MSDPDEPILNGPIQHYLLGDPYDFVPLSAALAVQERLGEADVEMPPRGVEGAWAMTSST